jgi:hypothetical protein
MARLDARISNQQAFAGAGAIPVDNASGLGYAALRSTAADVGADFVLLDLNPSAGSLNESLIMTSHFLLTPAIADFFSAEAMEQMPDQFLQPLPVNHPDGWLLHMQAVRLRTNVPGATFPLPNHTVRFLGYVLNRFRPQQHGPIINGVSTEILTHNEQHWANRMATLTGQAIHTMAPHGLAVPLAVHTGLQRTACLGRFHDFGNLGDLSSIFHLPVSHLTLQHAVTVQNGVALPMPAVGWPVFAAKVQWWRLCYLEFARTIVWLCNTPVQAPAAHAAAAAAAPAPGPAAGH